MAWEFLKSGVTHAYAEQMLSSLLVELGNIHIVGTDATYTASSYMIWVELAESRLLEVYQRREVTSALHSQRYWQIRAVSRDTQRPFPLIEAERLFQQDILESMRSQLRQFSGMLACEEDESFIIPDSNVWVHGKLFTEISWADFSDSKKVSLLLPLVVADELDKL